MLSKNLLFEYSFCVCRLIQVVFLVDFKKKFNAMSVALFSISSYFFKIFWHINFIFLQN